MPEKGIDIIIAGVGGNCLDILDIVEEIQARGAGPPCRVVGFLDDDPAALGKSFGGVTVLGPLKDAGLHPRASFIFGIGSPRNHRLREAICATMGLPRERFATLVHPSASVSRHASLGKGTVIFPQVTVGSGARVGDHVLILPGSVVSHGAVVGSYTCVAGGVSLSGGVSVGHSTYLGTNASVRGNVSIGDRCLVGMGSVVLNDVPSDQVVAGIPARSLREIRESREGPA